MGDRVEIYRPLTINPKDIRRKRAAKNPVGRFIKGNRFRPSFINKTLTNDSVRAFLETIYSGGAVRIASFDAGKPGCDSGIVSKTF